MDANTAAATTDYTKLTKAQLVRMIAEDDMYPTEGQIKVWSRETKARLVHVANIRFDPAKAARKAELKAAYIAAGPGLMG